MGKCRSQISNRSIRVLTPACAGRVAGRTRPLERGRRDSGGPVLCIARKNSRQATAVSLTTGCGTTSSKSDRRCGKNSGQRNYRDEAEAG